MNLFRSRHLRQKQLLQRRTFLAAVGLGIAAPVALRLSKMAVAAPTGRPTRLLIYFVPHGVPIEHYEPGEGMDLNTGEGVLAPFEPFKQHLTVMRGVSNVVMDNHDAIRSVLTGDGESDSIDYIIGNELGSTAHVLGAHSYRSNSPGPDPDSQLVRHGAFVTPVLNPADALDDLFAGLQGGTANPAQDDEAIFREETITLTEGEVTAMQQQLAGLTTEANKLQIHLNSLATVKASSSGEGAAITCQERPALPEVEALRGQDVFSMNNFQAILDGHLEAVANAFVCGSSRIATIQNLHANAQVQLNFAGGPITSGDNYHDPISHAQNDQLRPVFAQVQRWFNQRLADKFLSIIDVPDPQDPEHTVLENTTVLTTTEICDGFHHNSAAKPVWFSTGSMNGERYVYLPWNIIGGGGGCFSGGRVVEMDGVDHRQILAAVAHSMGVTLSNVAGQSVSLPSELLV